MFILCMQLHGSRCYMLMFQTWDCGFVSHSLHMGVMVDKTESRELFSGLILFSSATNFIPPFLHTHLIHFISSAPAMVWGMVSWHACYLQPFNKWGFITSHPLTWPYVSHELRIFILFSIGKLYYDSCVPYVFVFARQNSYCNITQFFKKMLYIFPAERVWNKELWMSWKLVLLYFSNIFFILC